MSGVLSACVIGDPVSHSLSPIIHGYWLKKYGIVGRYDRHHISARDFPGFLASLRERGYAGANVTVPHKIAALGCVDAVHPSAEAPGAVNTIWFEGDRMMGANSDVTGFVAHLDQSVPEWREKVNHALVLGAGGAARAVVTGLVHSGIEIITIANRTRDRATSVRHLFPDRVKIVDWGMTCAVIPEVGLIVNATSLGMAGQDPLGVDLAGARPGSAVFDIVYAPLETTLLKDARRYDLVAIDGLGMLLHQAALGFEKWFGVTPDVTDELRSAVLQAIKGRG